MKSPILDYIYQYTGIDPAYYLFAMAALIFILLILIIVILCKQKKLRKRLDVFLQGKDGENLEEIFLSCMEKSAIASKENKELQEEINLLKRIQCMTYQKMGMVKYDAFREMSGELSYAVALLDQEENGLIINSVYANEGSYSYIKEIKKGGSEIPLSEEEGKALNKAKNKSQA